MGVQLPKYRTRLVIRSSGQTWIDITGPITFPGVSTLAIDPQDRMTVYAGTGHGPQMGPGGDGLYKSTDGGQSWSKLSGIPDVAVPAVAIYPGDSGRIAVGAIGPGVFVSNDGGVSFQQRNNGFLTHPAGLMVWALAIDPRDPNVMYAGTNKFYGGDVGAPNALYKTSDGGLNWTVLLGGETVPGRNYPFLYFGCCVDSIAINAARPDEVYVALHDPGVVFSDNGGQDWRYLNDGLVSLLTHVYPYRMTISNGGEFLYATSCGRSVFKNRLNRTEAPFTIYLPLVLK